MAIQVNGTTVLNNSRQLTNITGADAATVAALATSGVGGGTDVTTLSGSSVNWDVNADSMAIQTLSADSNVTFTNIPTEHEWTYWYNSGANPDQLSFGSLQADVGETGSYNSFVTSSGSQKPSVLSWGEATNSNWWTAFSGALSTIGVSGTSWAFAGGSMNDDGTIFILGISNTSSSVSKVIRFDMSTGYDLNTATFNNSYTHTANTYLYFRTHHSYGKGLLVPGQHYQSGNGSYIYQKRYSTDWRPDTAASSWTTLNTGDNVYSCWFSQNGTYLFYINGSSNVYRRTCSTAFDISTAGSATNQGYAGINYDSSHHWMSPNGKKSYYMYNGYTAEPVYIQNLETAFDYSTVTDSVQWQPWPGSYNHRYNGILSTSGAIYYDPRSTVSGSGAVILDMRGAFAPNFTNMTDQPVVAANSKADTINKVDFVTRDGGSNIYGVASYNGSEG